ncbi:MAG: UDP-N-acetylglucosamine 1-carboxyvinyltransferase [Actinobacteria bacterium]|nr:UDP-N-acetylglucosamine 1-carboxyvinyltransferase [Actinomycetota bacterium]
MAVALLAPGKTVIHAVPNILDVTIMAELLRRLGCTVGYNAETETVEIEVPETIEHRADYDLVRRMRASIAVLGPLVARTGAADVALPGGDAIGSRGLDMHTAGLERMGATVANEHGYLVVHAPDGGLIGTHVYLDFPSVGATETLLMAAVTANGVTVIDNAAREPEISDICNMLLAMGAQIDGVGTSLLTVTGVSSLRPVEHTTVSDRIVAGTWAVAAAITGGDITVRNANNEHLSIVLEKLITAGAEVEILSDGFRIQMNRRPTAVDVVTLPYPGFPTDLQPQFIALSPYACSTGSQRPALCGSPHAHRSPICGDLRRGTRLRVCLFGYRCNPIALPRVVALLLRKHPDLTIGATRTRLRCFPMFVPSSPSSWVLTWTRYERPAWEWSRVTIHPV